MDIGRFEADEKLITFYIRAWYCFDILQGLVQLIGRHIRLHLAILFRHFGILAFIIIFQGHVTRNEYNNPHQKGDKIGPVFLPQAGQLFLAQVFVDFANKFFGQ